MEKKAVEAARIEFNRATDSIDALRASNRREEVPTSGFPTLLKFCENPPSRS